MRRTGAALLVVALSALRAASLPAQQLPAARSALQLAAEGRSDSARRLLDGELRRARPGDASIAELLFVRARLAHQGENADRDLRRVVIEYGNSPWADDALLELTQLAMAAGNPAGALDYVARLRTDYPGSELRPRAALWAGRAAFDVGEPRAACALLDSARAEAGGDIEFANQVDFYRARCAAIAAAPAATPPGRPVVVRDTTPRPATPAGRIEVQVAASSSGEEARRIAARFQAAGHRAAVVRGADGLFRVRLGPYATDEEAQSAVGAARRLAGGAPFVVRTP